LAKLLDKLFRRTVEKARGDEATRAPDEQPIRDESEREKIGMSYAQRVFERYNINKTLFLIEQLSPRKKAVFDLIPLLIHVSGEKLLDCRDACRLSARGVYGYQVGSDTLAYFQEAFPGRPLPVLRSMESFDARLPVKSISVMGSLGSIAQNAKSDFDYWVVIDGQEFTAESRAYFSEKLNAIEAWARGYAGAEVHFFPLDIRDIRRDNFGMVAGESSGTAQGKILKEEFYRTMTLVAGQTPLWWLMPPGVSDEDYVRLADLISSSSRVDDSRLIDMGNIRHISQSEFYGATIWQINKTIGSPFKSVLKMALLEDYMVNHGSRGLLCTELKQRLLSNEQDIQLLDPYLLMFDRASTYLIEEGRFDDLELVRRSLYLKSGAQLVLADHRRAHLSRKKKVMINLVREWGWNHNRIEQLNRYATWSYQQTQEFNKEINQFIVRAYAGVSKKMAERKQQENLAISERDLAVLGRKLYVFYSRRTNKVEYIKNMVDDIPSLNRITLQPSLDALGQRKWLMFRAFLSWDAINNGHGAPALLKSSNQLTELLIWLVNNQLYDSNTSINLNAGEGKLSTRCTVPDLMDLLVQLKNFFPPIRSMDIDDGALLSKPNIAKIFAVINLEEHGTTPGIVQTDLCYRNTWGEVFFKEYGGGSQEGLRIARTFLKKYFSYDPLGALDNCRIYMPRREFRKILGPRLNKFFGVKLVT
jgi:adenylate cyclase, class 1